MLTRATWTAGPLAVVACLAVCSLASPASVEAVERGGVFFGFGLGGGSLRAAGESRPGVALELRVGMMRGTRTAFLLDLSGINASGSEVSDADPMLETVAVQRWLTRHLWLKGGLGLGATKPGEDEREVAFGWGFLAGAGYEAVERDRITVDLQVQYLTTSLSVAMREGTEITLVGPRRYQGAVLLVDVNWW